MLPAHDAILTGDTLTSLSINREWRKLISNAIEAYLSHNKSDELTLDNEDLLSDLFLDFYD